MKILVILILLLLIPFSVPGDDMLVRSKPYIVILKSIFNQYWPNVDCKYIAAGQVEQESDWNPKAHLHTKREDGYGLTQITVTPRFNNFKNAVDLKPLKSWHWKNDKYNPTYQLTFLVLEDRSNFNMVGHLLKGDAEIWKGVLVSYNAGYGRLERRHQYAVAKGLPHDCWTGGLELAHGRTEDTKLYGETLWKTVNAYPVLIFKKAEKYKGEL